MQDNQFGEDIVAKIAQSGQPVYLSGIDSNSFKFRLGNLTFECSENPDDGYRSSMSHINVYFKNDKECLRANISQPIKVKISSPDGGNLWHFKNDANDDLLLIIGTDNGDEYYPSFTFNIYTSLTNLMNDSKSAELDSKFSIDVETAIAAATVEDYEIIR